MKNFMRRMALLVALVMMSMLTGYAQAPSAVEMEVNKIVKKYENVKGVDCISVTKGSGLELLKMMLNKKFGKSFMKGVTGIVIIEYSDASEETCMSLRKDLDVFLSLLQEFDVSKDKEFADNDYIRSFASVSSDTGTLSDFVIALENKDSKAIMYMAGEIRIEKKEMQ